MSIQRFHESEAGSLPEPMSYFAELDDYNTGPGSYMRQIELAKKVVGVPVIASLNGVSRGGWVRHARQIAARPGPTRWS